jgi:hypothetical protein
MAKDTQLSALTDANDLEGKLVVYQREIDFSQTKLASGDYFELFTLPTQSTIVSGSLVIGDRGDTTAQVSVGSTGNPALLAAATNLKSSPAIPFIPSLSNATFSGNPVIIYSAAVAEANLGVAKVTLVVLNGSDFSG